MITSSGTTHGSAAGRLGVRVRYLLFGAVIGGLWLWGSGEPAWVHALRTALFVVVALPVIYYGAQKLRARRGRPPLPDISMVRIIGTKLTLLVVALAVSYLIAPITSYADLIIAAGLFAVVAVGGPFCHHLFVREPARPGTGESR